MSTPDSVDAQGAAAVWGLAQRCALGNADSIRRADIGDESAVSLGDALFDAILAAPHGLTFTVDDYDETIRRLETPDKRVSLAIPALLERLDRLSAPSSPAALAASIDYPFVLARLERV